MTQSPNALYRKYTDEALKRYERRFNKQTKLRFQEGIKIKSLEDIIRNLFSYPKSTYTEKGKREQCYAGARRSAEDVYRLCRFYKIKVSYKDVYLRLEKRRNKSHCSEVNKIVYR